MDSSSLRIHCGSELSHQTAHRLVDPLVQAASQNQSKVVADLSGLQFATPFGSTALVAMLDHAKNSINNIRLVCPTSSDCLNYLQVSGLLAHASRLATLQGGQGKCPPDRKSKTVLPLTNLQAIGEIESVAAGIENQLDVMFGQADKNWEKVKSIIRSTIVELCQNVFDHAGVAGGWIAAQKYKNHYTGKWYVEVSIADAGCGIRNSLCRKYPRLRRATDSEALMRMLKEGLSCRASGGGMGYNLLQRATYRLNGQFLLRSGSGAVERKRRKSVAISKEGLHAWPGTQLFARLTCA